MPHSEGVQAVAKVLAARTGLGRAKAERIAERVEQMVIWMRNEIAGAAATGPR